MIKMNIIADHINNFIRFSFLLIGMTEVKEIPNEPSFPQLPGNKWMILSVIMSVLLIASVAIQFGGGITGMVIGEDEAVEKAISYISNFGVEPQLVESGESNGLYYIKLIINQQNYLMYMSKDGELLFPNVFVLSEGEEETEQPEGETGLTKSDKPSVELFVMSHCPYGTQAEKGILPVLDALGDKIDFDLRFVYYAMHGETEIDEQTRQYCIQKEQNSKFLDYLSCFLEEGDSEACLASAGIDTSKLDACIASADEEFNINANLEDQSIWLSGQFPIFEVDMALNEKYDVQGSPTLVVNGQQVSSARDPQSLLNTICAAFNTAPEQCNTQLSSEAPSPGFGFEGTGSDSSGQCG